MRLVALILISALFCVVETLLFVILPEKTNKVYLYICLFSLFMLFLIVGTIAIYKLGVFWNLESHIKLILGICCLLVMVISFLYRCVKK